MADGFIKLHRKLLDWEWYDDANTKILFLHCLLRANWDSGSWHGIKYQPGQFITSLPSLSEETGLTIKQVRTALAHLKKTGEVADKTYSKFRVITVNNWVGYQVEGRQGAGKGQARGRQRAADKEIKEVKEIKNKKIHNFHEREMDYAELEMIALGKQQ